MFATLPTELADDVRLRRLLLDVIETQRPLAIYLFGSRAEGRARDDSDYDLLVVQPDDAPQHLLDPAWAYGSVLRARVPADIVPTSRELFLTYRDNLSTLEGVAHQRGRLLYGAV